jgi:hypothetical protein
MREPSDDDIDHLLSRGGLGRQQKERALAHVLATLPPRPAQAGRRRWWIWGGTGTLSLAAGVAILALWLRGPGPDGDLRDKGAAAGAPVVDMTCLGGSGGSISACPRGSRVAFSLEGGRAEAGFVTAYADPIAGGQRVWYLTNQPVDAPAAGASGAVRVVAKAAIVGDEQPPGRYRVEVTVTRRAVDRADLPRLAPADLLVRARFELVVSP